MTKSMVNHFWQRWSAEYIQQLQRLKKWRKPSTNLRVGDVVIIKEDHTFLQQWPMARVIATPRSRRTHSCRHGENRNLHLQASCGQTSSAVQPGGSSRSLQCHLSSSSSSRLKTKSKKEPSIIMSFSPPPPPPVCSGKKPV